MILLLRSLLVSMAAFAVAAAAVPSAEADRAPVHELQRPGRAARGKTRVSKVKRARARAISPSEELALAEAIDRRAQAVGEARLDDARLRADISTAPMRARMDAFQRAAARRGHQVRSFERRLRGMLKTDRTYRVAKPMKTFVEVTSETIDLFQRFMGENVVWFGDSGRVMVGDQNGGDNLVSPYQGRAEDGPRGRPRFDRFSFSSQYLVGAQLTGAEMDRFVRYLNAGVAEGGNYWEQSKVYGRKGVNLDQYGSFGWAQAAPVGELRRWIRTVDRRVALAAAEGRLPGKFRAGLHAALSRVKSPAARAALVAQVVAVEGLGAHTRSLARRLGKEFEHAATHWPLRPLDLVGRHSLAQLMGVSIGATDDRWLYDLTMSKRVPVVGVLSGNPGADFGKRVLEFSGVGNLDTATGRVLPTEQFHGVVPRERRAGRLLPPAPRPDE